MCMQTELQWYVFFNVNHQLSYAVNVLYSTVNSTFL